MFHNRHTTRPVVENYFVTKKIDLFCNGRWGIPRNDVNATYWILWRWMGISFEMSWWMRGRNGGQFLSSITIPATKKKEEHNKMSGRFLNKIDKTKRRYPPCAIASSFRLSSWTVVKKKEKEAKPLLERLGWLREAKCNQWGRLITCSRLFKSASFAWSSFSLAFRSYKLGKKKLLLLCYLLGGICTGSRKYKPSESLEEYQWCAHTQQEQLKDSEINYK